jgi:hypothetical protein
MMKPEQFQQLVDQLRRRKPFQPFVIVLDSGERILIEDVAEFGCHLGSATYCDRNLEMYFVDAEEVAEVIEHTPSSSPT